MKVFVKDLKAGDFIKDQVFSIEGIQRHKTKNGSPYFRLVLQDKTGDVAGNIWEDDFEKCNIKSLNTGDVVKIDAEVGEYKEHLQLSIKKLEKTDDFDITDLLQASEKDIEKMFAQLLDYINSIKDTNLKALLKNIFNDTKIQNKFKRAPAAEKVHHDFIGGLLEHILEMLDLSKPLLYYYKEANRDIVITGIILHDIGKIHELEINNTSINRTKEGKLVGHIIQGIELVRSKLPKGFPCELWMKIEHIMASHHHKIYMEYGSPVKQATIEAAIVHVCDYASSHVRQFQKAIKLGEGYIPGFSEYQKWIETEVYLD